MPVEKRTGYDYFSITPNIPVLVKQVKNLTQGDRWMLLPKYEEILKQKLSKVGVTTKTLDDNYTTYLLYKGNQEIGSIFFKRDPLTFKFFTHTSRSYSDYNTSSSNPKAIALRPVGKILDEFVQELARIATGEVIRPAIENKASMNILKDATGNTDTARNIGKMAGIVPNVRGVDIGQGRRTKKNRKYRSRKLKKTRKH